MKKTINFFKKFFNAIWHFIDRRIIFPITKLVLKISNFFGNSSKKFENWLSKTNTLLFVSLFLAIIIFIVVDQKILIFSENSAEVLKEQPINVIYNEEAYVIEGLPETVDVTLIGSKADLYFAKQSPSQEINVDLSGLKPGTHKVSIKYTQALPSIDYKVNPSTATVIIYPKVSESKTLTYDLLNQNKLDSKKIIKDVKLSSDEVVIKGAEHRLSEVATVKALINVDDLAKQDVGVITLKDVPLKAYDSNGKIVDVEIVPSKIEADVEIASPSKEVPIRIIPTGEVSFGKAISSITSNETTVTVYAPEETLSKLTYVPVKVDVSDLKENRTYKMELKKPSGVKSMSVNNLTVNVALETVSNKELDNVTIEYRNLNDGYIVQGVDQNSTKVTVVLKGVQSVIEELDSDDVTAYLDLKGYGEGEHEVEVKVEGTDLKVNYAPKTKKVKIKIIKE
ncbi:MAG: hypothetical protein IJ134_01625 [Bacilli bacterium]|nr:hypothetical protein [Bacilli bacterium]